MAPSEHSEQAALVRRLRKAGLVFAAVPNGGARSARAGSVLRTEGASAGFPDLLVFDPCPDGSGVGAALELKRANGRPSDLRPEQRAWLANLRARGWAAEVCFGADGAIAFLRARGYGV